MKVEIPTPMNLNEFVISKIRDYEQHNEVTLGTLSEDGWQEYTPGEAWDTVRLGSVWDARYVSLESIKKEHSLYVEQFEARMDRILGYIKD